jgi:hypothetical protein
MISKFESFLDRLKTEDNKVLIETITSGFKTIVESYADLREERVSALDEFNDMSIMAAQMIGNPSLSFLQNSKMQYEHLYKEDDEPELDMMPTSTFNQYIEPEVKKDEIQEDLGLTAGDLFSLNL